MAHYFVSPSGDDNNSGDDLQMPYCTIAKGVSVLKAGDVLNLRAGSYVESVELKGVHGSQALPIVIRSHPGEHATIDGSVLEFRQAPNDDWIPAASLDPGAHHDEFISRAAFVMDSPADRVNLGAFIDREPYVRLITYARIEDLRADCQTFGDLPLDDQTPGPHVTDKAGKPLGVKKPWVYMGPGIFYRRDIDPDTGAALNTGRIHIRLSHTANHVAGIVDYDGEVDPRQLRLAIAHKARTALAVRNSSFVRFENLTIRFGGETTLHLEQTENVKFDHVRILASTQGVHFVRNRNTVFSHCEVRGGVPGWFFRSDIKAQYYFREGDTVAENRLGNKTSLTLLFGDLGNTDVEIHHCEFLDAHDLYLFGRNVQFHHNWIHNLNDEALVVDQYETHDLCIHDNVVTQCLDAISYSGSTNSGPTFIYRNLIDLRQPTASIRPRPDGKQKVFRFGNIYKTHHADGPLALFQNTVLVSSQPRDLASYQHYRNTQGTNARRSFNNVFIAVNPDPDFDQPITLLPAPSFPGPTDGNSYFRIGFQTQPAYRYLGYCFQGNPPCPQVPIPPPPAKPPCPEDPSNDRKCGAGTFRCLGALRQSTFFEQSQSQYPPGYEASSIEEDPQFRRIGADGSFGESDDLRLGDASPTIGAGVMLPGDLQVVDPLAPARSNPDIGCYPHGSGPLQVGVDGRRSYPI